MPAKATNEFQPDRVPPPGETIHDALEELRMSQHEFAMRMGLTPKHVSAIIGGGSQITPEVALGLEKVLKVPARFWLNLNANYQEFLTRKEAEREMGEAGEWAKRFPVKEMRSRGWLSENAGGPSLVNAIFQYFAVANVRAWETVWKTPEVAFRTSGKREASTEVLSAWLRRGQILAQAFEGPAHRSADFSAALPEIRRLVGTDAGHFTGRLVGACREAGVALHLVPELPKLAVSGACFWEADRPVILLNLYHKSEDHFWFNFFHEAKHVLQKLKKRLFVDVPREAVDDPKEVEANEYAEEILIPRSAWRAFVGARDFSRSSIEGFAQRENVPAGIVVGRLQHFKHLPWKSHLNRLKTGLVWGDDWLDCARK
jgi:HTH-type transcriptional regulator / antitoxin HigA